jgi:hypothetical protein
MSKRRNNVRKKLDDESEEDDSHSISANKRSKSVLSSFSFDEENDGVAFTVKKSKQSKQFKILINQAPNIPQFVQNEDNLLISSGCSYNEQSLQELRESQQFSANPQVDETGEIVVITGELLETLDEVETSNWPCEVTHPSVPHVEISNAPNNDENEQIWEDQLATRGGIKLKNLGSYRESNNSKIRESHRSSSLVSIRQSINQNLQSAKESCVKQNKQIESTRVSLSSLNSEKFSSEELLKGKASDLLFLQVCHICLTK